MGKLTGLFFCLSLALGCTDGHCRRKADPPPEAKPLEAVPPAATTGSVPSKGSDTVLVYKYDGSLQCAMGKALDPEGMAKELTGIPVLSTTKKSDGLMHIQVCGSITGKANVFEIPAKYLKQAEGKGFKKWSFE